LNQKRKTPNPKRKKKKKKKKKKNPSTAKGNNQRFGSIHIGYEMLTFKKEMRLSS
jgi:hypothetical protein